MSPSNEPAANSGRFQPPDVRRRQILTAVADLLLETGHDALTISRVADRAGVAKGTVYLYFDSKQALISALQAEVWDRMLEKPAALLDDPSVGWAERLDALVAEWVHTELRHRQLYHVLFHELGGGAEPLGGARDLLVRLLRGGTEAGEFTVGDADLTADFLLHAYVGPCHHAVDPEASEERVRSGVQGLFRRVVGAADVRA